MAFNQPSQQRAVQVPQVVIPQVAHRLPQILLRPAQKISRWSAPFRSLGAEHDAAAPDTVFGAAQRESDFYGLSVKANRRQVVDDRIGRSSWCVSGCCAGMPIQGLV